MLKLIKTIALCSLLLLSSCATMSPPKEPALSQSEFKRSVLNGELPVSETCYVKGFRTGALIVDIIAIPFLAGIPMTIVDFSTGNLFYYDVGLRKAECVAEYRTHLSNDNKSDEKVTEF